MRKWIVGIAVAASCLVAGSVLAAESGAYRRIAVAVQPTIGVSGTASSGQVGPSVVPGGPFTEQVRFTVHGNTQYVDMQLCATNLYKADVPTSPNVIPLNDAFTPTLSGNGFTPTPENMALNGTGLSGVTVPGSAYTWDFACSTNHRFQSGQNGAFSWDVDALVGWNVNNYELPVGDYSGFVKLTVFTVTGI